MTEIDYIDWLLTMGFISTANEITDGDFNISDDCISWVGNDAIRELETLIIEEIEKTKNG